MGKKANQRNLGLIAAGIALAVFGGNFLKRKVEQFINGIGFKFSDVKVKIVSGVKLRISGMLTVTNQNSIGGSVTAFDGWLKYGKTGSQIAPIHVNGFQLPPKGSASSPFTTEIQLLDLASNVLTLVTSVINGSYKKLWLSGSLKTSFIAIPVETEIGLLSE